MSTIAVIGAAAEVLPFALAGAVVFAAADAAAACEAWRTLPPDVAVVVCTKAAATALDDAHIEPRRGILRAVLP